MRAHELPASLAMLAGCILLAGLILGVTFSRAATPLTPAQIAYATGGATLCGNNPFCKLSRARQ